MPLSNGPTNEALQLQNARDVIAGADMDIWGVAEIVSLAQWNNLKAQLPGFAGFIAKEPNVVNGAAFYSDFNNSEQNVGILYKTSIATVTDARVILTASDFDFAGRPPLQVTLRVTLNGATENIVVIVLQRRLRRRLSGGLPGRLLHPELRLHDERSLPGAQSLHLRQRRRRHDAARDCCLAQRRGVAPGRERAEHYLDII